MKLRSFRIDPATKDLNFDGRQRLQMVEGLEAKKQRLRLRLGAHLQEWFLDTLLGVPWMQLVEKGVPQSLLRSEIRKALLRDEEVERVEMLRTGKLGENRQLAIEFEVRLRDGSVLSDLVEVNL